MTNNSFTISAPSGTDIWRKPPTTDVYTGMFLLILLLPSSPRHYYPFTYQPPPPPLPKAPRVPPPSTSTGTHHPLPTFRSARLSFLLRPAEQYDQAGILLSFHALRGATHPFSARSPPKWIKTGVEYYDGTPRAATVACDAWADWSLAPVSSVSSSGEDSDGWVTVLIENSEDKLGRSLWVYQLVGDGGPEEEAKKIPLREICWPFGASTAGEEWDLTVEAYACRPAEGKGDLTVEFKDFEVKWAANK